MKPNILIIVIDSLRADHLSCYGYQRQTTPSIDRLAAEGCLFGAAFTAAPFSPASYASLFSNLYPHQHGVNGDTVRIWPNAFTRLAEEMKAAGYFTFGVSNNDFVSAKCNAIQGFDTYVDSWEPRGLCRTSQRALSRVRRHLGERAARLVEPNRLRCAVKGDSAKSVQLVQDLIKRGQQPFFGFLVLMDPHVPYNHARRRFASRTRVTKRFFRDFNSGRMWVTCMARRSGPAPEYLRIAIDCYDSEVFYADACVGRLCDWLRKADLLDNTIVVIAADHGEGFGEQGTWGHGFCLNDCLTRVPLVVRCPGYWDAGTRSNALVQLHDVYELCVSVAQCGVPRPERFPHCLTQAQEMNWSGRECVFSNFAVQTDTLELMAKLEPGFLPGRWGKEMWSVRSREWKYVEYGNGDRDLYDILHDPSETTPLQDFPPNVGRELKTRLAMHRNERPYEGDGVDDGSREFLEECFVERLRGLGYVE